MFLRSLLLIALTCSPLFGQVKIDGPKDGVVGYRIKAALTLTNVQDPIIRCFPANNDWLAVQDFSGNRYIDFVPGKKLLAPGQKSQLFTFVVAGNKDNKTFLETWEVVVFPDWEPAPTPPTPAPDDITKTDLYKNLLGGYQVSPNLDALDKVIAKYAVLKSDIDANKFKSNAEIIAELKDKFSGFTDLKPLRDQVTTYLSSVAPRTTPNDSAKLSEAFGKIITCLKTIPRG